WLLDGRRVAAGTTGAKRHRLRARKWYGAALPGQPRTKRVPLATSKPIARRMLDDLVRAAERGEALLPHSRASRKSLADHLTDFERDARLGLASRGRRRRRKPSPTQVALVVQRIRDILNGCRFLSVADLNSESPTRLAEYLHNRTTHNRADDGLSQQSA